MHDALVKMLLILVIGEVRCLLAARLDRDNRIKSSNVTPARNILVAPKLLLGALAP